MWFKLCGAAVLCAMAILLVKSGGGLPLPLQWSGQILLMGAALLMLSPLLEWLGELCVSAGMGEQASLLLRGLGVALLTQFCADFCRQSGEGNLAAGVELAGKAELLLLCLPMLQSLVETAKEMLNS